MQEKQEECEKNIFSHFYFVSLQTQHTDTSDI